MTQFDPTASPDPLERALRQELQARYVPFDADRADEMIRTATDAELMSARWGPARWQAPLAAAAAVVVVGGGVALIVGHRDTGGDGTKNAVAGGGNYAGCASPAPVSAVPTTSYPSPSQTSTAASATSTTLAASASASYPPPPRHLPASSSGAASAPPTRTAPSPEYTYASPTTPVPGTAGADPSDAEGASGQPCRPVPSASPTDPGPSATSTGSPTAAPVSSTPAALTSGSSGGLSGSASATDAGNSFGFSVALSATPGRRDVVSGPDLPNTYGSSGYPVSQLSFQHATSGGRYRLDLTVAADPSQPGQSVLGGGGNPPDTSGFTAGALVFSAGHPLRLTLTCLGAQACAADVSIG